MSPYVHVTALRTTPACRHFLRELREKQVAIKLMDETAAEVVRDAARKWVHMQAAAGLLKLLHIAGPRGRGLGVGL